MIIGGVGAFPAAAIGGLLLGVIESLVVWQISARWQSAVSFVILILILLTRPYGLLSRKRRVEEI
jgi:branched-chain amino acid transport system permease protein